MDTRTKFQQPGSKGLTTDGKKTQDVSTTKFPKSSRRRESPGSNSFPKNEPRKSNAQKTKNYEKRTKSKGYYSGGAKEDSKVGEKKLTELGSELVPRNKKQYHNHLLNFYHPPRNAMGGWDHGRGSGYHGYHYHRGHRKYSKDDFLQTNCQFVVTAKGDYSRYLNDPDVLVDWNLIQQIRLHSTDNLSCPICLSPPVAGKITRCGHVYCWPCILHYLALSDKSYRKCPICDENIKKSDLKSVVEITEKILNIGDNVSFKLMRKEKRKLIAVPVNKNEAAPKNFITVAKNTCKNIYSKLLLANDKDILEILELEKLHLEFEKEEDPDSPEICFIQQALGELDIKKQPFQKSENNDNDLSESSNLNQNAQSEIENSMSSNFNFTNDPINVHSADDLCSGHDQDMSVQNKLRKSINDTNSNINNTENTKNVQKFFYFYQADNGQNIFLHPMNVDMLVRQYGNLENCPLEISGKLVDKVIDSVTEDLRNRMRYLDHLPRASQIEIVEIELQPPFVTPEVLSEFEVQILSRKEKRERRDNEERQREKKITEQENKLMGKYPTPKIHIESRKEFPQFQPDNDDFNATSPTESTAGSSVASSPSASWFEDAAAQMEDINQLSAVGTSYAQKLQTLGARKSHDFPSLNTRKKRETQVMASTELELSDPEIGEYLPPAYRQSFGEALAQAFRSSDLLEQGGTSGELTGKKKKKKAKATVLLSTNMARKS